MIPQAPYGDEGFTLLELLVAITLLGLLSLALFGGVSFGMRVWDRSEKTADSARGRHVFEEELRDRLSRADPELDPKGPGEAEVKFQGAPDRLSFLAPVDESGQLSELSYRYISDDANGRLEVSSKPELARSGSASQRILLKDVAKAEFSYFGSQGPGSPTSWRNEWQHATRLPQLVRIRLWLGRKKEAWPELVIPTKLAGDINCIYDPLTKFCQGR